MKHIIYPFLTFLLVAFANVNNASAQQVNAKIQELYGDKTQQVLDNEPAKVAFYKDLLENRIKITEMAISANDKYPKLSEVALLNKNNPAMTRDVSFDPTTFNPLKYNFTLSSQSVVVYRVDNTNYLIVIQPQTLK